MTIDRLDRMRRGDETALEQLMAEFWAPLVLYLLTILGSRDSAQDAAQEAFVCLWERRENWQSGSARALLFTIGRNVALDYQRRAHTRNRWKMRQPGRLEQQLRPYMPDEELEASEFQARFAAAMETLPPRRREVFELVRFKGLTYHEVADVLDLSPQTVANQMTLAHRGLRSMLADLLTESKVRRDLDNAEESKGG